MADLLDEHIPGTKPRIRARNRRILEAWIRGETARAIATNEGCSECTVNVVVCTARALGAKIRRGRTRSAEHRAFSFVEALGADRCGIATVAAKERGVTLRLLMTRVMQAVIDDNLFDAVLDDRG